MDNLNNKVVVITGASSGIGFGIAKQCAKEGARIMLAAQNEDKLEKAAKELQEMGADVSWQKTNVEKDEDWAALVAKTLEKYGQIDYLFSNAGISFNKSLFSAKPEEWQWIFNVNFWAQLKAIGAVLPVMMAQETGGRIVFTGSFGCVASPITMVPYSCTKAATMALAEGLQNELNAMQVDKIKVSLIMPAYVSSNIQHNQSSRPDYCKDVESNSNEMDKMVWEKIATDLESGEWGTISADLAGERIIDQVKRGHFYVYTHRNFVKAIVTDRSYRMMMDKSPFDPVSFMGEYYGRKVNE